MANKERQLSIEELDENMMRYKFCPSCGGKVSIKETKSLSELKCLDCNKIFYQNPAVGVAAILIKGKKVLLGRRNISYSNMWCIPCGYVEYYEDVREAVVREFKEETNLDIKLGPVFNVHSNFHNPEQRTVGIWFMVEEYDGAMAPDDDIDELEFFSTKDIEDKKIELAFPTDKLIILELKEKGLIE